MRDLPRNLSGAYFEFSTDEMAPHPRCFEDLPVMMQEEMIQNHDAEWLSDLAIKLANGIERAGAAYKYPWRLSDIPKDQREIFLKETSLDELQDIVRDFSMTLFDMGDLLEITGTDN
jgi:hypothetical protein